MKMNICAVRGIFCLLSVLVLTAIGAAGTFDGADTIDVRVAEYTTSTSTLLVKATSSKDGVTLEVYRTSTDKRVGTLDEDKDGVFEGEFELDENPERITVKSSGGGRAVADVEKK